MTPEELGEKVREIIPTATFEEDNEGQLIIYTGLTIENDEVKEFDNE